MKKFVVLCITMVLIFAIIAPNITAFADPISAAVIGQLSYGVGNLFGLQFGFTGFDNSSVTDYMERQVNSYLAGRSISEVFGSEFARAVAGKLIIPAQLYNEIRKFLSSFVQDSDISRESKEIFFQSGNYIAVSNGVQKSPKYPTLDIAVWSVINTETGDENVFNTGTYETSQNLSNDGMEIRGSSLYGLFSYTSSSGLVNRDYQLSYSWVNPKTVESSIEGSIDITPIGDDNVFQGENVFDPWGPDTNINDMLGDIVDQTLSGDIDISGEVVEPQPEPTPAPTPAPIDPDIPLQDVPWEGLNDLVGQTGADIVESVGQAAQDITGAINGVREGVAGLTDTITEALTPPEIEEKTFDLRELFPFCIPFDIYHLLQKFDASPTAPHVQLPIVIPSIGFSYTMDLDFSAWDPVAAAMRTAELIVYALGLAWATSKVIKW